MGVSDFRVIANLSSTAFAAQLHTDLVDLAQTRGAHRLAIGETAAVGVDRQMAVNASCTVAQQLFLLAVFTEAIFSQVSCNWITSTSLGPIPASSKAAFDAVTVGASATFIACDGAKTSKLP